MFDDVILNQMGIKQYILAHPELIKNVSQKSIELDMLSDVPVLVFNFDKELVKTYLYNMYGYLTSIDYPCYWQGDNIPAKCTDRLISIGADEKYDIVATASGKAEVWNRIKDNVAKWQKYHPYLQAKTQRVPVILDRKGATKYRWLYNFAGFLAYNGLAYSWVEQDASEKAIFIGTVPNDNIATSITFDTSRTEDEQKRSIFNELKTRNLLIMQSNGKYTFGSALV